VSRNLLSCFKGSLVFQINRYPGGPERMTADWGKYAGVDGSTANHSVSLRTRHCPTGGLFLTKGLKKRRIGLKTGFLEILDHS
jgi:hypothetical protein